jgi:hypothetical protein
MGYAIRDYQSAGSSRRGKAKIPRDSTSPLALSVLVRNSHERADSYRRFCQESLQSGAHKANSALYANLAKPLFAGFYGKLLIPRLGT